VSTKREITEEITIDLNIIWT